MEANKKEKVTRCNGCTDMIICGRGCRCSADPAGGFDLLTAQKTRRLKDAGIIAAEVTA